MKTLVRTKSTQIIESKMAVNLTLEEINELLALVDSRMVAAEAEQNGASHSNQALMQMEMDVLAEIQMKLEAAAALAPMGAVGAANVANAAANAAVANAVVANAAANAAANAGGARRRRAGRKTRKARKGRKGTRKGRKGSRRA